MLALFIVYMVFMASIFAAECVEKIINSKMNVNVRKVNILRFIEPLKTLALLFSVSILEILILYVFDNITLGFVKATTVILGIAGIIYSADYIWNQYKLRGYDRVLSNFEDSVLNSDYLNEILVISGKARYVKKYTSDYVNTLDLCRKPQPIKKTIVCYLAIALVWSVITVFGIVLIIIS